MADEDNGGSETEMGNQQAAGKKKKKPHNNNNNNGHEERVEEYKYVSIVDVNPVSEEAMCHRIQVNSPQNSDVIKCSVLVGENGQQGSRVSRVSVNGSFNVPDGSSSLVEQDGVNVSSGFVLKDLPNGSLNGSSSPVLIPTVTISTEEAENHSPVNSSGGEFSTPDRPESLLISPHNGFVTPDSRLSPVEPMSNGHQPMEEDLCSEEEQETLEERVARAVRQTLAGKDAGGMDLGEDFQEEVERVVREKLKRQRSGSSDYWNHDDTDDHCIVDFLDKINDHVCTMYLCHLVCFNL